MAPVRHPLYRKNTMTEARENSKPPGRVYIPSPSIEQRYHRQFHHRATIKGERQWRTNDHRRVDNRSRPTCSTRQDDYDYQPVKFEHSQPPPRHPVHAESSSLTRMLDDWDTAVDDEQDIDSKDVILPEVATYTSSSQSQRSGAGLFCAERYLPLCRALKKSLLTKSYAEACEVQEQLLRDSNILKRLNVDTFEQYVLEAEGNGAPIHFTNGIDKAIGNIFFCVTKDMLDAADEEQGIGRGSHATLRLARQYIPLYKAMRKNMDHEGKAPRHKIEDDLLRGDLYFYARNQVENLEHYVMQAQTDLAPIEPVFEADFLESISFRPTERMLPEQTMSALTLRLRRTSATRPDMVPPIVCPPQQLREGFCLFDEEACNENGASTASKTVIRKSKASQLAGRSKQVIKSEPTPARLPAIKLEHCIDQEEMHSPASLPASIALCVLPRLPQEEAAEILTAETPEAVSDQATLVQPAGEAENVIKKEIKREDINFAAVNECIDVPAEWSDLFKMLRWLLEKKRSGSGRSGQCSFSSSLMALELTFSQRHIRRLIKQTQSFGNQFAEFVRVHFNEATLTVETERLPVDEDGVRWILKHCTGEN